MLYTCAYMCVYIRIKYHIYDTVLIGFILFFSVSICETDCLLPGHFSIFLLHFSPLELLFLSLTSTMCKGIVTSLCLLENPVDLNFRIVFNSTKITLVTLVLWSVIIPMSFSFVNSQFITFRFMAEIISKLTTLPFVFFFFPPPGVLWVVMREKLV